MLVPVKLSWIKYTFQIPELPTAEQYGYAREQPEQFRSLNRQHIKEGFREWLKIRRVFLLTIVGGIFVGGIFISKITFASGDGDGLVSMATPIAAIIVCSLLLTLFSFGNYVMVRNNYIERVIELARTCDSFELFCQQYSTITKDELGIGKSTNFLFRKVSYLRSGGLYNS